MLLVIDVGNTHTKIGVYDDEKLCFVSRLRTQQSTTDDQMAVWIDNFIKLNGVDSAQVGGAIISAVVPGLGVTMKRAVARLLGLEAILLGPGVKTGLNIRIDNPGQMGSDLVAAGVAAQAKYSLPLIVFGLGTATTISVLTENGLIGGSIYPGVGISLNALASNTALLAQVNIEAPKSAIGTNTEDCMKSGVTFGTAAMIDGMTARIEAELGASCTLVATGGYANDIIPACTRAVALDDSLVLEGLRLIYMKNR